MPSAHVNARSSTRGELPLELRVYGLEGITETQDEALTQQAITAARHDERLGAHDVILATHTEQIGGLVKTTSSLGDAMSRLTNALYVASLAVATSAIGIGVAIAIAH